MGRMARFSIEEIEAACQALQAEGRYSVGNVRLHLGGGGYAYLAPICQAWAERTATAALEPIDALVPEGFRRAVHDLVGAVRAAGRQEASVGEARVQSILDETLVELAGRDAHEAALQTELDDARAQAVRQTERHEAEATSLRQEMTRTSEAWAHAQALLATVEERCSDATAAQRELQIQLDEVRAARSDLLQKVATLEERCACADRRSSEAQMQHTQAVTQLEALRNEASQHLQAVSAAQARSDEQTQLVGHLREDLKAAVQTLQAEKQERIAATQRAQASSDAQVAALQGQGLSKPK